MYNILRVLKDPRMGYKPCFIHQMECTRHGGKIAENLNIFCTGGVIHPGTERNRELLPEEYRQDEYVIVYCLTELTVGKEEDSTHFRTADIIDLRNRTYWRVVRAKKWGDPPNIFYVALAVKTDENPWKRIKEAEKNERSDI